MHGFHIYMGYKQIKRIFLIMAEDRSFWFLNYKDQLSKISSGLKKFDEHKIKVRSFFAPNHTYDLNTLKALESGIRIVIDGYGLFPFSKFNIKFVPQLFYREIMLPFEFNLHKFILNYWNEEYFKKFTNFIEKKKIQDIYCI